MRFPHKCGKPLLDPETDRASYLWDPKTGLHIADSETTGPNTQK